MQIFRTVTLSAFVFLGAIVNAQITVIEEKAILPYYYPKMVSNTYSFDRQGNSHRSAKVSVRAYLSSTEQFKPYPSIYLAVDTGDGLNKIIDLNYNGNFVSGFSNYVSTNQLCIQVGSDRKEDSLIIFTSIKETAEKEQELYLHVLAIDQDDSSRNLKSKLKESCSAGIGYNLHDISSLFPNKKSILLKRIK